jgi:hypothetical protein
MFGLCLSIDCTHTDLIKYSALSHNNKYTILCMPILELEPSAQIENISMHTQNM